jgi:hypothetical protein
MAVQRHHPPTLINSQRFFSSLSDLHLSANIQGHDQAGNWAFAFTGEWLQYILIFDAYVSIFGGGAASSL